MKTVAILATLDTKGAEAAFMRDVTSSASADVALNLDTMSWRCVEMLASSGDPFILSATST